jgi:hypothetical protein
LPPRDLRSVLRAGHAGDALLHVSELFGEEYARLAVTLNDARGWAKETLPTYQDRKEFFEGIVNGEPDPIELLGSEREAVLALVGTPKSGPRRRSLRPSPPSRAYGERALALFPALHA